MISKAKPLSAMWHSPHPLMSGRGGKPFVPRSHWQQCEGIGLQGGSDPSIWRAFSHADERPHIHLGISNVPLPYSIASWRRSSAFLQRVSPAAAAHLQAIPPPPLGLAWRSTLVVQHSKIRVASNRDCGVFFGAVFMRVFRTDILGPVAGDAPIGFDRRPSGCKGAFVLDRELEL